MATGSHQRQRDTPGRLDGPHRLPNGRHGPGPARGPGLACPGRSPGRSPGVAWPDDPSAGRRPVAEAVATEGLGRLVSSPPFVIGHEVAAIVARVVGVGLQATVQAVEPGQLRLRDRRERGRVACGGPPGRGDRRGRTERSRAARPRPGPWLAPRTGRTPCPPSSHPGRTRCRADASERPSALSGRTARAHPRDSRGRSVRRSRTAASSSEAPSVPPLSRRSVATSSATWRRQKPSVRSRPARNPRSSTRSLMIASRMPRSARARTVHTGQPPARIASSRRVSTRSRADGSTGPVGTVGWAGSLAAVKKRPQLTAESRSAPSGRCS